MDHLIQPIMIENDGISHAEHVFRGTDQEEDRILQSLENPASSNLVPVPNQRNAFFASGFQMIDPQRGDLEKAYMSASKRDLTMSNQAKSRMLESYAAGKPVIDRTNQILKRLQMQTPGIDANLNRIKQI